MHALVFVQLHDVITIATVRIDHRRTFRAVLLQFAGVPPAGKFWFTEKAPPQYHLVIDNSVSELQLELLRHNKHAYHLIRILLRKNFQCFLLCLDGQCLVVLPNWDTVDDTLREAPQGAPLQYLSHAAAICSKTRW